ALTSANGVCMIYGLDHVQLAMPAGEESTARTFYGTVLGLKEVRKPSNLARRGGVWFESGHLKLHLGVERGFRPARKAQPAFLVRTFPAVVERCRSAGVEPTTDEPLDGFNRCFIEDPFGNRIELLEPLPLFVE